MRKQISETKHFDILENTWPVLFKTIQLFKNKESLRNYHSQEEPKRSHDSYVECGTLEGILEQKKDIR